MAKTHKITIRIEEDLRDKAHAAIEEMGMSLSEYVHTQLELVVRRKELNEQLISTEKQLTDHPKRPVGVSWLIENVKPKRAPNVQQAAKLD